MEEFYGSFYECYQNALNVLQEDFINLKYIESLTHRIKEPISVLDKLVRKNKTPNFKEALTNLNDIAGLRVVLKNEVDVYKTLNYIKRNYEVLKIKDYIKNPKSSGYKSIHIILNVKKDNVYIPVEVQLRTIAQDMWANYEHDRSYKKGFIVSLQNLQVIG